MFSTHIYEERKVIKNSTKVVRLLKKCKPIIYSVCMNLKLVLFWASKLKRLWIAVLSVVFKQHFYLLGNIKNLKWLNDYNVLLPIKLLRF